MTTYERIEKVIRFIDERQDDQPRLETLAKVAGLSPFHFHRLFSRWAGVTPKDFLKFLTNENAKRLLARSRGVLDAAYSTGLSGPGRLHDLLVTVEGVTPGEYKARGAGLSIVFGFHDTPFGEALIAATRRGVCFFAFADSKARRAAALSDLRKKWPKAGFKRDDRATGKFAAAAFRRRGKIPVHLAGTPFQIKVWEALLRIPPGKAVTYGDVARAVGRPKAVRAVGTAVGSNAVACLIPCHRVIRETGALGGYRWGPARKRAMLAREGAARTNTGTDTKRPRGACPPGGAGAIRRA